MTPSVGEHRIHVRALNTWKHWADGHDVPDGTLHTTFAVLAHRPGPERQLAAALRLALGTTTIDGSESDRLTTPCETAAMRGSLPHLGIEM